MIFDSSSSLQRYTGIYQNLDRTIEYITQTSHTTSGNKAL